MGVSHTVESFSLLNDKIERWVDNKLLISQSDIERLDEQEVDKKQKYSHPDISANYIEATTDTERKLVNLWQTFFKYDKIGILDDFFEIGGDSLKSMTLSAQIQKEFNVRISVAEFFKHPIIKELSEYIDEIQFIEIEEIPNSKNRKVVKL